MPTTDEIKQAIPKIEQALSLLKEAGVNSDYYEHVCEHLAELESEVKRQDRIEAARMGERGSD